MTGMIIALWSEIQFMKYSILLLALSLQLGTMAQAIEDTPLIHTRGTAIVYAEPDEALFNFSVITEGENLGDARKQNSETAAAIITYLKKTGIKPQHIQTQYLNVGIRYRDYHRRPETKYYLASQYIQICVTDMNKYEEVMMGLLALNVENLSTATFRTTRYAEHMHEAREKAVLAAKDKAERMAKTLGQTVGKAHTVDEVDLTSQWSGGQNQNAYANVQGQDAGNSSVAEAGFATGQLEIKATIDVYFQLLEK
jgi:hypothetical protein